MSDIPNNSFATNTINTRVKADKESVQITRLPLKMALIYQE
jgi:hypothetical protein